MSVIAVERAIILLRYIINDKDGLSIREASRDLGYSPATVQKLINALNSQGYVVQDELTERYHLGPEAVQLGLTALSRLEVRRVARPYLETISRKSNETVFLAIRHGNYVVYVDKVVTDQPIRMDAPLGEDRPYNCTAVGKVLSASLSKDQIINLERKGALEKRTGSSIVEVEELFEELALVRNRGWALDNEEFSDGVGCVAVPVYDHEEQIIAAVTVTGPAERINQNIDQILEILREYTGQISAEMGYREVQTVIGGN